MEFASFFSIVIIIVIIYDCHINVCVFFVDKVEERFNTGGPNLYRGAHAIVIAADVTDMIDFRNIKYFVMDIDRYVSHTSPPIVVAAGFNIEDQEHRAMSKEDATAFCSSLDPQVQYFEVSTKTGEGIDELFHALIKLLLAKVDNLARLNTNNPNEKPLNQKKNCIIC